MDIDGRKGSNRNKTKWTDIDRHQMKADGRRTKLWRTTTNGNIDGIAKNGDKRWLQRMTTMTNDDYDERQLRWWQWQMTTTMNDNYNYNGTERSTSVSSIVMVCKRVERFLFFLLHFFFKFSFSLHQRIL
jgi:hypothetical protein